MKEKMIVWFLEGLGKDGIRQKMVLWITEKKLTEWRNNMSDSKSWYTSKTIIVAILQLAGTVLAAYLTSNPAWAYAGLAKSVLDIGMRLTTTQAIESPAK